MALYYTIDEFIETLSMELRNINNYTSHLYFVSAREKDLLKKGWEFANIKSDLEAYITNADLLIEEVQSALSAIDFTKYAFEVRVDSPGLHHHTELAITGTPGTTFSTTAKDAEDISINAYDNGSGGALFTIADIVEIINSGNLFMDGFFTITGAATVNGNTYAEAALVNAADSIDQAYNIVVRLRER